VLDQWLPGARDRGEAAQEVFDFTKAVDAFVGREDVLRKVLSGFLETGEQQVAGIASALEEGALEVVRQEAHSMKGGAWNLAAIPLGRAAARLEEAARAGESETARSAFDSLRVEFDRLKSAAHPYTS
jgi:HPt (histidine-containing phosphotransfer) domain-containing protein